MTALSVWHADKVATPSLWCVFWIVFCAQIRSNFLPVAGGVDAPSLARFKRGYLNLRKNKTSASEGWYHYFPLPNQSSELMMSLSTLSLAKV